MLEWRDALPISTRFDDPYYSADDGRAETEYVFIDGNNLKSRWLEMESCTIAELGFGTGLNFLETVRHWRKQRSRAGTLHFNSFEQHPMQQQEMAKAFSQWPELKELSNQLCEIWAGEPIDTEFDEDIRLTVHIGDANELLPNIEFNANAWYLDGFSPAKNPELWNEELMNEVGKHTVAGGTFSTYTAAGFVKRNLQNAGFEVIKSKGFGRKRDMLIGAKPNDIHVAYGH